MNRKRLVLSPTPECLCLAEGSEDIRRIIRNIVYRCRSHDGVEEKIREMLADFSRGEAILRGYRWPGNVRKLTHHVCSLSLY